MNQNLKDKFYAEIFISEQAQHLEEKWLHLGRAHILSQFHAWPHFYIHWKMFQLAVKTFTIKEILGQIPRLILAIPGSLTKKAPKGNTGLSNVGIFTPMTIPNDLEEFL